MYHRTPSPQTVLAWLRRSFVRPQTLPSTLTVVSIPIDAENEMLALYLTRSPAVDARLRALGWQVRALHR